MMLSCSPLVNKTILLNTVCVCVGGSNTSSNASDPDLEIRGMAGGGGGGRGAVKHNRRFRGGPQSPNFFFRPFGPHIALKLREGAPGGSATENNTL